MNIERAMKETMSEFMVRPLHQQNAEIVHPEMTLQTADASTLCSNGTMWNRQCA